ncbi:MAG: hypothetical protein ABIJ09_12025, partial [Pseudomonadota bacterium]
MSLRPRLVARCSLLTILWAPLACPTTPAGPDSTATPSRAVCGNDRQQRDEVCDGSDLDNQNCEGLGFGGGVLACRPDCRDFDRSNCNAPTGCGDGQRDGVELCDGVDLAGQTCESLDLGPGTLRCLLNCADFDRSACTAPSSCGDRIVNGNAEVCDTSDFGGLTCADYNGIGGELRCADNCLSIDSTGCQQACAPQCGTRQCGPDPVCGAACGTCSDDEICSQDGQCDPAPACLSSQDLCAAGCTLDINPMLVTLNGSVHWDGRTIEDVHGPSYAEWRLSFVDVNTGASYTREFDGGSTTYSMKVYPGTYDVDFSFPYSGVFEDQVSGAVRVASRKTISSATTLDVNPSLVQVVGSVHWDGRSIEDVHGPSYAEWRLSFVEVNSGSTYTREFDGGSTTYSMKIYPGTYDVDFSFPYSGVFEDQVSGAVRVASHEAVNTPTTLDVNPTLVTLSGQVHWDGSSIEDVHGPSYAEWRLSFVEVDSGYTYTREFDGGSTTYSMKIYPGTYDVDFSFP